MPACSTARRKAPEVWSYMCDGDATTPLRGSVDNCVKAQTQNYHECPARGYSTSASGITPLRPRPGPQPPCPCTRQLLVQAGVLLGNIKAWIPEPLPSRHDDRAVIVTRSLTRSCKPSPDPHARSIQKLGEPQTMLAFQKTEDANHFIRVSTPASAATAEVFRSPEASVADPCTAPCRRRTARPPMPDDAWRPKPCAYHSQPGQKCLDFAAAQGCRVTHNVETDEGTNPVDISLFGGKL